MARADPTAWEIPPAVDRRWSCLWQRVKNSSRQSHRGACLPNSSGGSTFRDTSHGFLLARVSNLSLESQSGASPAPSATPPGNPPPPGVAIAPARGVATRVKFEGIGGQLRAASTTTRAPGPGPPRWSHPAHIRCPSMPSPHAIPCNCMPPPPPRASSQAPTQGSQWADPAPKPSCLGASKCWVSLRVPAGEPRVPCLGPWPLPGEPWRCPGAALELPAGASLSQCAGAPITFALLEAEWCVRGRRDQPTRPSAVAPVCSLPFSPFSLAKNWLAPRLSGPESLGNPLCCPSRLTCLDHQLTTPNPPTDDNLVSHHTRANKQTNETRNRCASRPSGLPRQPWTSTTVPANRLCARPPPASTQPQPPPPLAPATTTTRATSPA